MEKIESSKLNKLRLERARGLTTLLRDEIDDLKRRLNLVEVHNKELQELFDKLSADQAAIDLAIDASLEDIEKEAIDSDFDSETNDEIADAEDFAVNVSDEEDDFSFDEDEE